MSAPQKYRKKPVVIEAIVFDGTEDRLHDISRWMSNGSDAFDTFEDYDGGDVETIGIETLEGVMQASRGDFIIKGVRGEFYPCKPDIFAQTYDAVEAPEPSAHRATLIREAREHVDHYRRFDNTESLVSTLVEMSNALESDPEPQGEPSEHTSMCDAWADMNGSGCTCHVEQGEPSDAQVLREAIQVAIDDHAESIFYDDEEPSNWIRVSAIERAIDSIAAPSSAGPPSNDDRCPECRGEITSWFCDPCGNTGRVKP